jgi:hypothetical protein
MRQLCSIKESDLTRPNLRWALWGDDNGVVGSAYLRRLDRNSRRRYFNRNRRHVLSIAKLLNIAALCLCPSCQLRQRLHWLRSLNRCVQSTVRRQGILRWPCAFFGHWLSQRICEWGNGCSRGDNRGRRRFIQSFHSVGLDRWRGFEAPMNGRLRRCDRLRRRRRNRRRCDFDALRSGCLFGNGQASLFRRQRRAFDAQGRLTGGHGRRNCESR